MKKIYTIIFVSCLAAISFSSCSDWLDVRPADEIKEEYLFETGNADSLIEKMETFIKLDPAEKAAMGKAGREKVEREFDRKMVIRKYCDEVANS